MPLRRRTRVGLSLMTVLMALSWVAILRSDNAFPPAGHYHRINLVTNQVAGNGRVVNPWGIAYRGSGPFWINDEGSGFSSVYFGDATVYYDVEIPSPQGASTSSAPTGIVANSQPADFHGDTFIFATETGTISGWQKSNGLGAEVRVDNSATDANYKGLALGHRPSGSRLFATNFRSGTIDAFDANYRKVASASHHFKDPSMPAGYAPFGIATIENQLWVTYAMQDGSGYDDSPGAHRGFIDVFTTNGHLVGRFASGGALNSPWGMAVAPQNFGQFSGNLLVGNFGDGKINAFDLRSGEFKGALADQAGNPIVIDGLWGIIFGNDGYAGRRDNLFFTAGPDGGKDGLFGRINAQQ
jgi:uncharacterized protein (TIGR03118 family)